MNFETSKWTTIILLITIAMLFFRAAEAAAQDQIQSSEVQAIIGRTENGDLVVTSKGYEEYKKCLAKNSKEDCMKKVEVYILPNKIPQDLNPGELILHRFKGTQ